MFHDRAKYFLIHKKPALKRGTLGWHWSVLDHCQITSEREKGKGWKTKLGRGRGSSNSSMEVATVMVK